MIPIDDMEIMLDDIAAEFPEEFFDDLNGGILLLPEEKLHAQNKKSDLFILGEYCKNVYLGRYIAVYYGSFVRLYGYLPEDQIKEKLRGILRHEFRHHLESLSGERGLEIKDAEDLANYLSK